MHNTTFESLLTEAFKKNTLAITPHQTEKLIHYLELLQTWNHAFNLTAITSPHDMVYLHIIDSLLMQPFLEDKRFLDVGSGAGLPGIPLAITHPDLYWNLLDKNGKKTRFLTQAIAELGLKNAQATYSRCEDFQPSAGFDSILSRAFGTISMFVETTEHLLNPNGRWIAMKGKYPEDELEAIPSRFKLKSVTRITLEGTDVERHVVCLSKK